MLVDWSLLRSAVSWELLRPQEPKPAKQQVKVVFGYLADTNEERPSSVILTHV